MKFTDRFGGQTAFFARVDEDFDAIRTEVESLQSVARNLEAQAGTSAAVQDLASQVALKSKRLGELIEGFGGDFVTQAPVHAPEPVKAEPVHRESRTPQTGHTGHKR